MKTASFTEFRAHAKEYFDEVEDAEVIRVLRHGKPVAEITPIIDDLKENLTFKRPGIKWKE